MTATEEPRLARPPRRRRPPRSPPRARPGSGGSGAPGIVRSNPFKRRPKVVAPAAPKLCQRCGHKLRRDNTSGICNSNPTARAGTGAPSDAKWRAKRRAARQPP